MYDETTIKKAVRDRYADHATQGTSCCGPASATPSAQSGCGCGGTATVPEGAKREQLGYDAADLAAVPEGADLGLGCGNPFAMLELAEGETVLDLGSGAGVDCFIAAKRVGASGRVIGVDMTAEMIDRARRNAQAGGYDNVEFRLGEIEDLPVADGEVDAIISNCVINLVPDKARAFREAYRVLKPGGRLSVSDIVVLGEIPPQVRDSAEAYVACLAGAIDRDEYLELLRAAGFAEVAVESEQALSLGEMLTDDLVAQFEQISGLGRDEVVKAASQFASVRVRAVKSA